MNRILIFTFILSFIIFASLSQQQLASHVQLLRKFDTADHYFKRSLQTNTLTVAGQEQEARYNKLALQHFLSLDKELLAEHHNFDSLHFFVSLKTGELAHYFDSLPLALHYYLQAIQLQTRLPAFEDSLAFKPAIFAGHIYFYNSQLDSATFYFQKAEDIQAKYKEGISESERLYNDLGVLYFQSGNYRQAGNYFRKASAMLDTSESYYEDFRVNYDINYAISLFKQEQYKEALAILMALLPFHMHEMEIWNNIGLIYEKQGDHQKALNAFQRVHFENRLDIGLQNDKAVSWLALGVLDSVRSSLATAVDLNNKYNKHLQSTDHGLTLKIFGDLQVREKHFVQALKYYQQAISRFYPAYKSADINSNPESFSGVFSYIQLFNTLISKAETFHAIYVQTGDVMAGNRELNTYAAAFNLVNYTQRTYDSDEARLFLQQSKYLVHDKPIDIAFELYRRTKKKNYLEQAFVFDQQNKASVLVFNEWQKQVVVLSDGEKKQERALKTAITRLSLATMGSTDKTLIESRNSEIRELEIRLGKIQESLAKQSSPWNMVPPTITDLQKRLLDKETILVSYHVGKSSLSVFAITAAGFEAWQQLMYAGFRPDLQQFILQLRDAASVSLSSKAASDLSQFFIGQLKMNGYKRLVIIPDDELCYLPFEALKTDDHYLVEKFSIQYQYSTLLLRKESNDFRNLSTVSFAPFTMKGFEDETAGFSRLAASEKEVADLKGSIFADTVATRENFLAHLGGGTILHLATHAVVNDTVGAPSYIVFAPWGKKARADFLLYEPEIYNLSLSNNPLVILSACETGSGKLVRGEGIMSLSRAFAYAGCPNVITSLWKADDEAVTLVTRKFHKYLDEGFTVDVALQQAKKDYLSDKSVHPLRKLPQYWAHLVFIGNYQPHEKSYTWLWILAAAGLVGVVFFVAKVRRFGNPLVRNRRRV